MRISNRCASSLVARDQNGWGRCAFRAAARSRWSRLAQTDDRHAHPSRTVVTAGPKRMGKSFSGPLVVTQGPKRMATARALGRFARQAVTEAANESPGPSETRFLRRFASASIRFGLYVTSRGSNLAAAIRLKPCMTSRRNRLRNLDPFRPPFDQRQWPAEEPAARPSSV